MLAKINNIVCKEDGGLKQFYWSVAVFLLLTCPAYASIGREMEPSEFNFSIRLIDQDEKPVPGDQINEALQSIYLKAKFNFYAEGQFRASIDIPINNFKEGEFIFNHALPLPQLQRMGINPDGLDSYDLTIELPYHPKFPFSGSSKINLKNLNLGGKQSVDFQVKRRTSENTEEIRFRLISAVTGDPLVGYKLRSPQRKSLQTDSKGEVLVKVPTELDKSARIGPPLRSKYVEKFSGYDITADDLRQFQKNGQAIDIQTDTPIAVFEVREKLDKYTSKQIAGVTGYAKVSLYTDAKHVVLINRSVADGYFVLYAPKKNDVLVPGKVFNAKIELSSGNIAEYRISGEQVFQIDPRSETTPRFQLTVEHNAPVKLSIDIVNALDDEVIPGAKVVLFDRKAGSQPFATVKTNNQGNALFPPITPTEYLIHISADGYADRVKVYDFKESSSTQVKIFPVVQCKLQLPDTPSPQKLKVMFVSAVDVTFKEYPAASVSQSGMVSFDSVPSGPGYLAVIDKDGQVMLLQSMDPSNPPSKIEFPNRTVINFSASLINKEERIGLPILLIEKESGLPIHKTKKLSQVGETLSVGLANGQYVVYAEFPKGLKKVDEITISEEMKQKTYEYHLSVPDTDELIKLDELRKTGNSLVDGSNE